MKIIEDCEGLFKITWDCTCLDRAGFQLGCKKSFICVELRRRFFACTQMCIGL